MDMVGYDYDPGHLEALNFSVDSDMETAVSFSALQDTVHERKNEEQEETPSGSMPCVEMTGQNQKHHMAVGRFRTK